MYRPRRRMRREHRVIQEIPLTPLIDTSLTLLVIFMITAPMVQNAIRVDLPKGRIKEAGNEPQELVVYIDKSGTITFNGTTIKEDGLVSLVREKIGSDSDKMVVVKADKQAPYGTVMHSIDELKAVGGIKYVALATVKTE